MAGCKKSRKACISARALFDEKDILMPPEIIWEDGALCRRRCVQSAAGAGFENGGLWKEMGFSMCGRYYLGDADFEEALQAFFGVFDERMGKDGPTKRGEIFPGDTVPVIANNRRMKPSVFAMEWGYQNPLAKNRLINARSETAAQKPLFRDGAKQRRCLIPAGHYFEWRQQEAAKVKYAIAGEGNGPLFLAGLYTPATPTVGSRFVILTRFAAPNISFIHRRMPLILPLEKLADFCPIGLCRIFGLGPGGFKLFYTVTVILMFFYLEPFPYRRRLSSWRGGCGGLNTGGKRDPS